MSQATDFITAVASKGGSWAASVVYDLTDQGVTTRFDVTLSGQVPHPIDAGKFVAVDPITVPIGEVVNALPVADLVALANQTQAGQVAALTAQIASITETSNVAVAAAQSELADAKAELLQKNAQIDAVEAKLTTARNALA
jgi:hypothetical protein